MSDETTGFLSATELALMSMDPKLAEAARINAKAPTNLSPEELDNLYGNFKLRRYTLFSVPTFTIFMQGPVADLPPIEDLETNYKDYFDPRYCKVKLNAPTRDVISDKARFILRELAREENYSKLYNDHDYHVDVLTRLAMEGINLNKNLVGNKHKLQATLLEYRVGLDYWLQKNGYKNLLDWEKQTTGETLMDLRVTKTNIGDFIKSLRDSKDLL